MLLKNISFSVTQIKRSDSALYWEEREILAHANSDWVVQVRPSSLSVDLKQLDSYLFCFFPAFFPCFDHPDGPVVRHQQWETLGQNWLFAVKSFH